MTSTPAHGSLGSELMKFFTLTATSGSEARTAKSLGDFTSSMGGGSQQQAYLAAKRLEDRGFLINSGSKPGPPLLGSTYVAVNTAQPPEVYDFIVGGFPEILRRRAHAVLHLEVTTADGDSDSGSGFLVSPILMMTAKHCVTDQFEICHPHRPGESIPHGPPRFADEDIAVVPITGGHGLPFFSLGRLAILDQVMAMGFPRLHGLRPSLITSTGQIAGSAESYLDNHDYWVTTCALTGGSSGGPVVNEFGHAVGVVSALPAASLESRSGPFGLMVGSADGLEAVTSS